MTLADGQGLDTWEGGLFDENNENSVSLLYRLLWIFTEWRSTTPDGLTLNEAGRPFGVESDINVGRSGAGAGGTFSGRSTVCYQWGRYLLWLATGGKQGTPSAANPALGQYASQHTVGTAADIDSNDYERLDKLAERVGMKRTIPSEIWHYETYRNPDPDVDFSPFSAVVDAVFGHSSTAGLHITPLDLEEQELMSKADDIMGGIATLNAQMNDLKAWVMATLDSLDGTVYRSDPTQVYITSKGDRAKGTGAMMFIPSSGKNGLPFSDVGMVAMLRKGRVIDPDDTNVPINEYNAIARQYGLIEDRGAAA